MSSSDWLNSSLDFCMPCPSHFLVTRTEFVMNILKCSSKLSGPRCWCKICSGMNDSYSQLVVCYCSTWGGFVHFVKILKIHSVPWNIFPFLVKEQCHKSEPIFWRWTGYHCESIHSKKERQQQSQKVWDFCEWMWMESGEDKTLYFTQQDAIMKCNLKREIKGQITSMGKFCII